MTRGLSLRPPAKIKSFALPCSPPDFVLSLLFLTVLVTQVNLLSSFSASIHISAMFLRFLFTFLPPPSSLSNPCQRLSLFPSFSIFRHHNSIQSLRASSLFLPSFPRLFSFASLQVSSGVYSARILSILQYFERFRINRFTVFRLFPC